MEKEDEIVSSFLEAIGPWSEEIVIGGGFAPIIYRLYFAEEIQAARPVGTNDIDSLISRRIKQSPKKTLASYLADAGFESQTKDLQTPATEAWVKGINNTDIEIEFLTDSSTRGDKSRNVRISGITAQPLRYLSLSLENSLPFRTRGGQIGKVVSPGARVFHKGLTFLRRKTDGKRCKDLYGIWFVSEQLGDFSEKAVKELYTLAKQYPRRFRRFRENLNKWLTSAAPSDWSLLEAQDPSGHLVRSRFELNVSRLTNRATVRQPADV